MSFLFANNSSPLPPQPISFSSTQNCIWFHVTKTMEYIGLILSIALTLLKTAQFDSVKTTLVSVSTDLHLEVFNGKFSLSSLCFILSDILSLQKHIITLSKYFVHSATVTHICVYVFFYLTGHLSYLFLLDNSSFPILKVGDYPKFLSKNLLSFYSHNYIT